MFPPPCHTKDHPSPYPSHLLPSRAVLPAQQSQGPHGTLPPMLLRRVSSGPLQTDRFGSARFSALTHTPLPWEPLSTPSLCPQLLTQPCVKPTIAKRLKEKGVLQNSMTSSLPLLILCSTCSTLPCFSVAPSSRSPLPTKYVQAARLCQTLPSPCPSQTMWRCQTLALPWTPPAPLPAPAERTPRVSPDPAPARTPEQAHPHGWHGLTFPEDTVHAIQGMGIAGRSERGRGQGPRLRSTAAAPPLPASTGGPGPDPPAPVRCCPRAATRPPRAPILSHQPRPLQASHPSAPASLALDPHSLAPLSRRLLHVVLHPRRQSSAGEGEPVPHCPLQHWGTQHGAVELCCPFTKGQESCLQSHSS